MQSFNQISATFSRHYPALASATIAELFNRALKRLLNKAQFYTTDVQFTNIVAGQREYPWNENDLRVYGVTWYRDANNWEGLTPTSEDVLNDQDADWNQEITQRTPCRFYIAARTTGLVIGFDDIPNVSTVNGFPYAVAHTEQNATISGTQTIPSSMLDELAIVYSMCEMWASEEDKQSAGFWMAKRMEEERLNIDRLKMLSVNSERSQILPAFGPFSRRVI